MKLFIIFFLLFLVSYGHSQSLESETVFSEREESRGNLNKLRNQLKRYVDSLMLVLLDEETPRENQIEILEEIKSIAEINGEITVALNQISQRGGEYGKTEASEEYIKANSLWIKTQAELIRRKHFALNELQKGEQELDEDFYVNLALDGIVILAGGVLFFVPAVGPAVSIPLIVGRVTLTGPRLGTLLMATGALESGVDAWDYFFGEEEQRFLSFVPDLVVRDVLTRELFNILSSANQRDKYLAVNLLRSTEEEMLINDLVGSIQEGQYSVIARQSAIKALRAVPNMNEAMREEVISVLKGVIDDSRIQVLRETSVNVLGEIGAKVPEVAEYLRDKGDDDSEENDKLRLIALIQLGRNTSHFPHSIDLLSGWLKDRDHEKNPLAIQPEIPDSFLDSLLLVKKAERSDDHITVLQEFILSRILDIELKLKFSETLMSWDDSSSSKALLQKAYADPVTDIGLYVENLSKEILSEKNHAAFAFLQSQISKLENVDNTEIVLKKIELIIKELERKHPDQVKIAEKIENLVDSYKKMLESIKN